MAQHSVLVTGASSGIGASTATTLAAEGYIVYGAARRIDRLQPLAAHGVRPLTLDVTDDPSIRAAVERIIAETGRIDVLINIAGYGEFGALEDVSLASAREQFEVNVFGAMRLTQLVLPHMRSQRAGRIVNITSVGGKTYGPLGGWYHASKYAFEALSDCLRLEARPFGIDVVIVEPGGTRTEWGEIASVNLEETSGGGGPYADQAVAVASALRSEANTSRNSPPAAVAHVIVKAATTRRPRTRYLVGYGARPLLFIRRCTSDRVFDWVISRAVGVSRPDSRRNA